MSSRAEEKAKAKEARLAAERDAEQAAARKKRLVTLGGILAAAAVIVVIAVVVSQSGTEDAAPPEERIALFDGIPQSGVKLGSDDAPVVVQEYADLQCPFCAQFASTGLPPIVTDYVKPGDVQMELRLMTFLGDDSVTAGRFAQAAAEQNKLWQFAEAFFADQGEENSGYVTEDFLKDIASKAGVDFEKASAGASDASVTEVLDGNAKAFEDGGLTGTPGFLVGPRGGELKPVANPEDLPGAIADALKQAGGGQSGT